MTGRIALVTGGTRGIGRAIAEMLKEKGYRVVANFHGNSEAAQKFTEETGIPHYRFNVADYGECKAGIDKIVHELGPIEILVNNAGITKDGTLHKMDYDSWEDVIHTNLTSCFNLCRLVIDSMRDRGFGRIVNIGSINGQAGQYGQVNYAAAKSGIHGFTKALALEVAKKGVTINTISPGYIGTKMVTAIPKEILDSKILPQIPVGRLGKPEEIAGLIIYLCSEEAAFVTGANISINGGQHMY